jgi:hypothetical protein
MQCINGKVSYHAVFIVSAAVNLLNIAVLPGDNMSATVRYNSNTKNIQIAIKDPTQQWIFSIAGKPTKYLIDAVWVVGVDNPSSGSSGFLAQFAKLKTWGDRAIVAGVRGSIGSFASSSVAYVLLRKMTQSTSPFAVMAQPTSLSTTGGAFAIIWKSAGPEG